MIRSFRRRAAFAGALGAALAAGALIYASSAQAQNGSTHIPSSPVAPSQMDMPMSHEGAASPEMPTSPGQGAFGAIQEIVRILNANPHTDWSKVDLEALRQHLIDMNDVTLHAAERPTRIPDGLRIAVTGRGRTVLAIKRMVADQAKEIERTHLNGWSASTTPLPNGATLTVTATTPKEIAHIRGLGFIGIMASGDYHQMHHLAMALGERMP